VIRTRATSIDLPPATTRSAVAVASPAWISPTNISTLMRRAELPCIRWGNRRAARARAGDRLWGRAYDQAGAWREEAGWRLGRNIRKVDRRSARVSRIPRGLRPASGWAAPPTANASSRKPRSSGRRRWSPRPNRASKSRRARQSLIGVHYRTGRARAVAPTLWSSKRSWRPHSDHCPFKHVAQAKK
jgi:hypothetical protein